MLSENSKVAFIPIFFLISVVYASSASSLYKFHPAFSMPLARRGMCIIIFIIFDGDQKVKEYQLIGSINLAFVSRAGA